MLDREQIEQWESAAGPEVAKYAASRFEQAYPHTWPFFPIVMPTLKGNGPASDAECDTITWEVWDQFCNTYASHDTLFEAIGHAMRLNVKVVERHG